MSGIGFLSLSFSLSRSLSLAYTHTHTYTHNFFFQRTIGAKVHWWLLEPIAASGREVTSDQLAKAVGMDTR
jgi:hypothetical protein